MDKMTKYIVFMKDKRKWRKSFPAWRFGIPFSTLKRANLQKELIKSFFPKTKVKIKKIIPNKRLVKPHRRK